ncbi:dihydrofolate reductase-like domain-containing protein [Aspergillus spectabilis]
MPPRPFKTRLFFATSLDNFIARPNNSITWLTSPSSNPLHTPPTPFSTRQTPTFEQHIAEIDIIIMGRVTFEVCLGFEHWPYPVDKRILVLSRSRTLKEAIGNEKTKNSGPKETRIVNSIEEIEQILVAEGVRMVYVDGGEVAREFLRRGWVDEMVVTRAPVLLGEGRGLFGGNNGVGDVRFTLRGVDVIEDGMVSCYYVKVGEE